LRELSAAQFLALLAPLTSVYAAAMTPPPEQLAGRRAIMERHACYAGFRALAVVLSPATSSRRAPGTGPHHSQPREPPPDGIVGFAYGFHGAAGQWWHDLVRSALTWQHGAQAAEGWLADSFEVAEIHVHPGHQGRGTGLAMMLRLTSGRPEQTAMLSTMDADTRARRLYRGLGFTDLLAGFAFPGAEIPYVIMGAPLPLRRR
jgi:GNAT superfamily N-acetyltransferase